MKTIRLHPAEAPHLFDLVDLVDSKAGQPWSPSAKRAAADPVTIKKTVGIPLQSFAFRGNF
jgi:hypothetical protein